MGGESRRVDFKAKVRVARASNSTSSNQTCYIFIYLIINNSRMKNYGFT